MALHLVEECRVDATIEVTDLAPTPVRDRVRSRATLTGTISPAGSGTNDGELFAVFSLTVSTFVTEGRSLLVDPADFAGAQPAFHATRADLLRRLGRSEESRVAYDRAIGLAGNTAETAYLIRLRDQLAGP